MTSLSPEQLASRAKELLSNEAFRDAIKTAREQVYTSALSCDVKDDLGRFRLLTAAKVIDGIERHLKLLIAAAPGESDVDTSTFYTERAQNKLSKILGL